MQIDDQHLPALRTRLIQLDKGKPPSLDPEVEIRLAGFMKEYRRSLAGLRRFMRDYPHDTVRLMMYHHMVRVEKLQTLAARLTPVVKEWTEQIPGLHQLLLERIQNAKTLPRDVAYVHEAIGAKREYDSLANSQPGLNKIGLSI